MPESGDLGALVAAAGQSLVDVQSDLTKGVSGIPLAVALSEAELEVKGLIGRSEDGSLRLDTISLRQAREEDIGEGLLSSIKVRYVAVAEPSEPGETVPERDPAEIIAEVRTRRDIKRLESIVGELDFDIQYVPAARRWLVSATGPENRVMREIVIEETTPGSAGG